jgi:tRNA (5-methylaminomethyl-2-thiouridylate)-methyltransferase
MKIAVGMSGGVDSSVTAAILKEQGHAVTGVFLEAYNEPGCRTDQDKQDALRVALKLGIPFQVLDLRSAYSEIVVKYFYETYRQGKTPNPDIVCNREVKFGLFYDWALQNSFEGIATGHYARIVAASNLISGLPGQLIARAADATKDQSYFLWQVKPDNLLRISFPLGEMYKPDVRATAETLGLLTAVKPDSMGVCMMGELNVHQFLQQKLGEKTGGVIFRDQLVGTHSGLWFHTIGQRVGTKILLDTMKLKQAGLDTAATPVLFVTKKDVGANTITIGLRDETLVSELSLVNYEVRIPIKHMIELVQSKRLFVRIRNLGELYPVSQLAVTDSLIKIETSVPMFGVADGQAGVLYATITTDRDQAVVAGGEISVY